MVTVYYCLTCKKRVPLEQLIMEAPDGHGYKHLMYYMQSGKTDYTLHPVRVLFERPTNGENDV
jgi:hypothetical protein